MESVFYGFETQSLINMNAREKLDEFAEMTGMNKNQLIGWSIAADFAEWYAEQVKNCSIPDVSKLVLLAKPNYKAKDGTIKQGIEIKGKYYAPQNDC